MKLLRVGTVYSQYWKMFYATRPYLELMTYNQQLNEVFSDFFSQSNSYTFNLKKLGYECEEIIANISPLQLTWAKENNIKFDNKDFVRSLPIEYIKLYKPDILLINDFVTFNGEWINYVKGICPSIRLIISWCSTDLSNIKLLRGPDLILTSTKPLVRWFKSEGLNVEILRHAFDERILNKLDVSIKNKEATFIGTLQRNRKAYNYRIKIVENFIKNFNIDIYSSYTKSNNLKILLKKVIYDYMLLLQKLNFNEEQINKMPFLNKISIFEGKPSFVFNDLIKKNISGDTYGINMFKIMASSLLSLNIEGNVGLPDSNYTGNIRVYEATGVGSCLLTDWKEDIKEIFEPDYEIVTFSSISDCIDKARWLLNNPVKCNEIAKAGQKRTLKDHTYKERCIQLDTIIKDNFKKVKRM